MRSMLAPLGFELANQADHDIPSPVEDGSTFIENALIKARAVSAASQLPAIADDSGLVVPALDGAPGIYSARYAGDGATDADNNAKLLEELAVIVQPEAMGRVSASMNIDVTDVIMEQQRTEKAGDAHLVEAEKDMSSWVDGRLAREMALEHMSEEKKKAWIAKTEARQAAMAAIKAVVEDSVRTVDEKVKRLQEMKATGAFDAIGGSHQSQLVLTEAIKKLGEAPSATTDGNGKVSL